MKEKARRLRKEKNLSINEISKALGIAKSTASIYCKGVKPNNPERLRRRMANNAAAGSAAFANARNRHKSAIAEKAKRDWFIVKNCPGLMGFLGLYWGEGRKTGYGLGITNNDPSFFKVVTPTIILLSPQTRKVATITYYESHDKDECENFWNELFAQNVTVVMKENSDMRSKSQFNNRCPYGRCDLRFSDLALQISINIWVDKWIRECACSSTVERLCDIQEVVGSIPTMHTIEAGIKLLESI